MPTGSFPEFLAFADFVLKQAEIQASTTKLVLSRIDNLNKAMRLRDQIAQMADPRIARKLRNQLDQFEGEIASKRDPLALKLKENLASSESQRARLEAILKRLKANA